MTAVDQPARPSTSSSRPLGRVEGDLDVRVTIEDGVVTSAWTEAAMFRGFEIILRGKDPQAGLIVTPRICGICGGSHLYKACYALDTAWATHVPQNATLIRNIAQACETLQSIPRYFYALFAVDLVEQELRRARPMYDEAVRRFAPYVGTSLPEGRRDLRQAGRGLRDLRRPVAAQFVHGAGRRDVRTQPVRHHSGHRDPAALEGQLAGEGVARLLGRAVAGGQELGGHAGLGRGERVATQLRLRLLHPLLPRHRVWTSTALASATSSPPAPTSNHRCTRTRPIDDPRRRPDRSLGHLRRRQLARLRPHAVSEDVTHSFYTGDRPLHPWEGETIPVDPLVGREQGKYSWAKSPRYDVPGAGPDSARGRPARPPGGRRWARTPPPTRTTTRCSWT